MTSDAQATEAATASGTFRLHSAGRIRDVVALAAALFAIYAWGACRTIYVGDSGELVAAAATLGIPHPSGYPFYVMLGWLWIHLVPIGSAALRMSLFSGFFAALAAGMLVITARRLGATRPWAIAAGLLLGLSPSFWSQATIQRVYALNAFFVVLVLLLALEWRHRVEAGEARAQLWMIAAAFAAGLGACNHTFLGIQGAVTGLWALSTRRELLRQPLRLLQFACAGLLGLLPYLYLPLRSRRDPPLDWGDPETLERFLAVVRREDFWNRAWLEGPSDLFPVGWDFATSLLQELTPVGLLAGLAALWLLRRRLPQLALPIGIAAANVVAMALHGSRSDLFLWHRYYIPSYLMGALLAGLGLSALAALLRSNGRRVAGGVTAAALLWLLTSGWSTFDRSSYRIGEDYNRQLLALLPPGARLVASDDNILFGLIYLQMVEGVRPDVHLVLQGVGGAELPNLRFDPDDDPIFFTHHPNWNVAGLLVEPIGLVYKTVREPVPDDELLLPRARLEGELDGRVPKDYLTQNLIGNLHYQLGVTFEQRDWPRAERAFLAAREAAHGNDTMFYNLGLIYRRNGLLAEALEMFERSHEINPRHLASDKPADAADRMDEIEAEIARVEGLRQRLLQTAPDDLDLATATGQRLLANAFAQIGESAAARGHALRAQMLEQTG